MQLLHQTVRLDAGRHRDPRHGACAVELASLLAREPFSDRPATVCPMLAAFVRGYNDELPPELRDDLRAVASTIVGTRTSCDLLRARRAQELLGWPRHLRRWYTRPRSTGPGFWHVTKAGRRAAAIARRDPAAHARTLHLLERLAGTGRDPGLPALLPEAGTPAAPAAA